MKRRSRSLLWVLQCLLIGIVNGQTTSRLDSLEALLSAQTEKDSLYVSRLLEKSYFLLVKDPDASKVIIEEVLSLTTSKEMSSLRADALVSLARVERLSANYVMALSHNYSALAIYTRQNDLYNKARVFHNLGLTYDMLSMYERALKNYSHAIELFDQLDKKADANVSRTSIAHIYLNLNEIDSAKKYIAEVKARENLILSRYKASIPILMARIEMNAENYPLCKHYLDSALHLINSQAFTQRIITLESLYAQYYFKKKNYQESINKCLKVRELGIKQGMLSEHAAATELLMKNYEVLKQPNKALAFLQEHLKVKAQIDSILNKSLIELIDQQIEFDSLAVTNTELLFDKQDKEKQIEKSTLNLLITFIIIACLLALMILLIMSNKKNIVQKKALIYANKQLGQSQLVLEQQAEELKQNHAKLERSQNRLLNQREILVKGYNRLEKLKNQLSERNIELDQAISSLKKQKEALNLSYENLSQTQAQLSEAHEEIKMINAGLEQKIAERTEKVIKANRELKTLNKELDLILYRSSHDFRRPLANIMGLYMIAKNSKDPNEALNLLAMADQIARQMDTMLHKIALIHEVYLFTYPRVADQQLHIFDLQFHEFTSKIQTKVINDQPLRTNIDPKLIQILVNELVENAQSFSKDRGQQQSCSLIVHKEAHQLHITVSDNGPGIPKKQIDKIFRMYFIGGHNNNGNGLGLYIVSKIIEKLNGKIEVKSVPFEQTSFHITLPILL